MFPLVITQTSGLGVNFGLARSGERLNAGGVTPWPGEWAAEIDLLALNRLDEVRTEELKQSLDNLRSEELKFGL